MKTPLTTIWVLKQFHVCDRFDTTVRLTTNLKDGKIYRKKIKT